MSRIIYPIRHPPDVLLTSPEASGERFKAGYAEAMRLLDAGDAAAAEGLFVDLAASGCLEAHNSAGVLMAKRRSPAALASFRRGADGGDPVAARNVGYLFALGLGVARDKAKAAEWYRRAAEMGNAVAMCNLGVLYEFGNGVARDDGAAAEWYLKSARAGYSRGMTNLGVMLCDGRLPRDVARAEEWLRRSGSPRAKLHLRWLMLSGDIAERFEGESLRLLEDSAASGYSKAMTALADLVEGADPKRARELRARAGAKLAKRGG